MNRDEAKRRFDQADVLYRQERYGEALEILDALDREFPDTRHVMYPRAMCLGKLKRLAEAVGVCDRIVERFGYAPARELRKALQTEQGAAFIKKLEVPDFGNSGAVNASARLPRARSVFLTPRVIICVGALLFLAVTSVSLFYMRAQETRDFGVRRSGSRSTAVDVDRTTLAEQEANVTRFCKKLCAP